MIYEAILFDMDGVIIDTHHPVTNSWQDIAQTHNVHLTETDFEQHIYGCPIAHTLDILFPHLNADERRSIFQKLAFYEANLTYIAVAGALELLQTLRQNCVPTVLVTSGDRNKVSEVTHQLDLNGLFAVRVTAEDIHKGKPSPDCYLKAARQLQKSPEQCIVFEDAISGVKAGMAAGALCIGVSKSSLAMQLLKEGARCVVPDLKAVSLQVDLDNTNHSLYLQVNSDHYLPLRGSIPEYGDA